MFVTVELAENIPKNTAVSFNASSQKWEIAVDTSQLIGVVKGDPYQDNESGKWFAPVGISGLDCFMIAHENIPNQGGFMHVNNGKIYVDNSGMGCGTISPINVNESTRQANSLVLVHLR
tara:strand:- start:430 stop:786 length:357 start_codon:yes stop_codon:yes gene_type:complete